jgi:hypothetical protein
MATFRKRGTRWHVQVRRRERQSQTRSFASKAEASDFPPVNQAGRPCEVPRYTWHGVLVEVVK